TEQRVTDGNDLVTNQIRTVEQSFVKLARAVPVFGVKHNRSAIVDGQFVQESERARARVGHGSRALKQAVIKPDIVGNTCHVGERAGTAHRQALYGYVGPRGINRSVRCEQGWWAAIALDNAVQFILAIVGSRRVVRQATENTFKIE